ncbi:MAG: aldehyde ferredoxin oxidoreductase family protein [Bacillota bacterium]|nr:aldehyde ferredoxin oxidoreductase family protein [Bacillota bacterium]
MENGYTKKLLSVNLRTGETSDFKLEDEILEKFIGGRGLGGKLLYDLMSPGVDPLSPENVLLFLTGPLTGTIAPGGAKFVVVTKSPATGTFLDSYSSGKLAVEIRMAGYDGLLITGKAEKPSYLYIQDDVIEVRDAGDLWGKDSFETEKTLTDLLGEEFGVTTIGPAGEKLVNIACINSDYYRQAGRGGGGAVMGSKNLKAIAVRGTKSIKVHDPQFMMDRVNRLFDRIESSKIAQARIKYGTPMTMNVTASAGMLPTRNFQTGIFPEGMDEIDGPGVEKLTIKTRGCYACPVACGKVTKVKEGIYKDEVVEGPEYETASMMGSNWGVGYLPSIIKGNEMCDRLGIDTISAGALVSFAMECYERGIISEEELGYKLNFGNYQDALALVEDIALRRGFGDILADGSKIAAEKIGKDSIKYAMQSKNLEFPGYDPRAGFGTALTYAVSPRGACHRRAWPPSKEVLGNYLPHTVVGKAEMVKELFDENTVFHSLLVCDFPGKFIPMKIDDFAEFLEAAVGRKYTASELMEMADMIETQIRMFNTREGFDRKDDVLPDRIIYESHPEGPSKGKVIGKEDFNRMLSEYYELRGWDDNGIPESDTIKKYNLI